MSRGAIPATHRDAGGANGFGPPEVHVLVVGSRTRCLTVGPDLPTPMAVRVSTALASTKDLVKVHTRGGVLGFACLTRARIRHSRAYLNKEGATGLWASELRYRVACRRAVRPMLSRSSEGQQAPAKEWFNGVENLKLIGCSEISR